MTNIALLINLFIENIDTDPIHILSRKTTSTQRAKLYYLIFLHKEVKESCRVLPFKGPFLLNRHW